MWAYYSIINHQVILFTTTTTLFLLAAVPRSLSDTDHHLSFPKVSLASPLPYSSSLSLSLIHTLSLSSPSTSLPISPHFLSRLRLTCDYFSLPLQLPPATVLALVSILIDFTLIHPLHDLLIRLTDYRFGLAQGLLYGTGLSYICSTFHQYISPRTPLNRFKDSLLRLTLSPASHLPRFDSKSLFGFSVAAHVLRAI